MKKVLLINPPLVGNYKAKYKAICPPLGLLTIGAVLKQNGFTVSVIDGDMEDSIERIIEKSVAFEPDYIGLTATSMSFLNAIKISQISKSRFPGIIIVMGGVHATYYGERILKKYVSIDCICRGEGEFAMLEIAGGIPFPDIKGLIYRNNDCILFNSEREQIADLDILPFPARELVNQYTYRSKFKFYDIVKKYRFERLFNYIGVSTSRGCHGGCYFCCGTQFNGRKSRIRSAENVIRELDGLINQGYDFFYFTDDYFTAVPERVIKICTYLKNKRKEKDIGWFCSGRIDALTDDIYRLMKEAGCFMILFGVEHIADRIRNDYYRKNISVAQIEEAFKSCEKYDINIYATTVVGSPVETNDDIETCIKFYKKHVIDILEVHRLMVFPGSAHCRDIERDFKQKIDSLWEGPIYYHQIDQPPSEETVMQRFRKLNTSFYMNPRFIIRQLAKIIKSGKDPAVTRCEEMM